jgi:hypothetical protein
MQTANGTGKRQIQPGSMPMKRANSNDGGTKVTTLAFRYQVVKRRELELISAQKGHANLSDTLRD